MLLGVLIALAVGGAALSQTSAEGHQDPGREMALSAGCDLSQDDVWMLEAHIDYYRAAGRPMGEPTVESAVSLAYQGLIDNGATFSKEELTAAASAASTDSNLIQVRVPGASIDVVRWEDGTYSVTGYVQCA
jgi:hypothetical protein